MNGIGVYRESSLHAALKDMYGSANYRTEVSVSGFIVDLFDENQVVEIQTGNFSNLRNKLQILLETYRMLIVYPITVEKYIVRLSSDRKILSRRKSPVRGSKFDLYKELVYITRFLGHPNLSFEMVETIEEVYWIDDGKGSWRRSKWSIYDRKLLATKEIHRISGSGDYFMNAVFEDPFTVSELAQALRIRRPIASKMAYCLKAMGLIEIIGKKKRSYLYQIKK